MTSDVAKTDKVYSSRYRARQRLYRRKVKPAKIDNPLAIPADPALVIKGYTKPELRERLKNEVMAGSDGGKPGQWSARKAQLLAQKYESAGGGYTGRKTDAQKSLSRWTDEKWRTSDGKDAIREGGTRRYLPDAAWDRLTDAEKAATNRKKIEGSRKGEQFVPNTAKAKEARREEMRKQLRTSVEKAHDGDKDGLVNDGKPTERPYNPATDTPRPKPKKIPPPPSAFLTPSGVSQRPKMPSGIVPKLSPRPAVREKKVSYIAPTIVERTYKPQLGNGKPDPGEIVSARVYWRDEETGKELSKVRPVLILGPVKGKPGVMAAIEFNSYKQKDNAGLRRTTHIPVPSYSGDRGIQSLANISRIVEIWPEDFDHELDGADEVFADNAWKAANIYHASKRGGLRKSILRKSIRSMLRGAVGRAGKGYAADKLRGGARIAQSMTAAERSARTKAGWQHRQRAKYTPKVSGGFRGGGLKPKGDFGRFYERPVGSMLEAARDEKRQKLRRRAAGQYGRTPEFKTGRTALDDAYANPLGAYREGKQKKVAAVQQRDAERQKMREEYLDRRGLFERGEASRARQAQYAARRKEIIEAKKKEAERQKQQEDRAARRAGIRDRLGTAAKDVFSQTEMARGYAAGKQEKERRDKQRSERRQARKDMFNFIRTGDESIIDRYIPEDALKDAQQRAEDAAKAREAEEDRIRNAPREEALRRAKSREKQKYYRNKREKLIQQKEREKARDKDREERAAERQQRAADRQKKIEESSVIQEARAKEKEKREADRKQREAEREKRSAERAKTADERKARQEEIDRQKSEKVKRDAEYQSRRMEIMEQREKDRQADREERKAKQEAREKEREKKAASKAAPAPEEPPAPEPTPAPKPKPKSKPKPKKAL